MSKKLTTKEFIKKANIVHNNKYDYSLVDYKNNFTKIKIICPIHGIFEQIPKSHVSKRSNGCGCHKCGGTKLLTQKEFIKKAKKIHGDKYDYSLVDYKNNRVKVKIICPIHGVFEQQPIHHISIQKCGCPICARSMKSSVGEKEVLQYIQSIYSGKIIENDRNILDGKELDIYLPDLKLAFEYNGEYWHNLQEKRTPGYHELKQQLSADRKIKLVYIWENDWRMNQLEIKNIIKALIA